MENGLNDGDVRVSGAVVDASLSSSTCFTSPEDDVTVSRDCDGVGPRKEHDGCDWDGSGVAAGPALSPILKGAEGT